MTSHCMMVLLKRLYLSDYATKPLRNGAYAWMYHASPQVISCNNAKDSGALCISFDNLAENYV